MHVATKHFYVFIVCDLIAKHATNNVKIGRRRTNERKTYVLEVRRVKLTCIVKLVSILI